MQVLGDVWTQVREPATLILGFFLGWLSYYFHTRLESQQQEHQAEMSKQALAMVQDALRRSHDLCAELLRVSRADEDRHIDALDARSRAQEELLQQILHLLALARREHAEV